MTALNPKELKKLTVLAIKARGNAYCPYSNHPVGAALLGGSGKIYVGANSETAHYLGTHAEAAAIAAMTTAGERSIRAIVIVGPAMEYLCTPCGDCRQRLREFADKNTRIYSMWQDGSLGKLRGLEELLPLSFGPENIGEVGLGPNAKKTDAKKINKKKTKKKKS